MLAFRGGRIATIRDRSGSAGQLGDELGEFLPACRVQKRVLGALFMREIQIRWGRRNLGFAWLFAEPLVFAFPVLLMWSMMRSPFEHGLPLMPFIWSGYLPLLMFRHTSGRALYVIRTDWAT